MIIRYGEARINLATVKQYKPIVTYSNNKSYYKIELLFLNGEKEELHFFSKKEERDEFIEMMDKKLYA
jgi:hypothetical protein